MKMDPRKLEGTRRAPGFLMNTQKEVDPDRDFTLVLAFSRRWCVRPFFTAFEKLRVPMERCHLLIFCNKDSILLINDLKERAEAYKDFFKSVQLYCSYRRPTGTSPLIPSDPEHRGKLPFIYSMYLDILDMVKTEVMIVFEDDTVVPGNAVMRLLNHMRKHKNRVFVSGIETNRGPHEDIKTRLGVHYIKRRGNRILERISLDPNTRGVVPVDATGWYCCASTPDIWRAGFKGIEKYFMEIPRFALDMFHTNNIKKMGIPVIADFGIWCLHMQPRCDRIIYWGKKQAIPMADIWIPKYKTYAQGVVMDHVEPV